VYRFGPFELDAVAFQLRRDGIHLPLERQPLDLLLYLVERRGGLVSREEIAEKLWGRKVFVDVEAGINTAVRKLRRVLRDSTAEPVYIETVAGKGYRFAAGDAAPTTPSRCVAVLPVEALDDSPDSRYLADGITEEMIAALGQAAPHQIRVIGRTTMMQYRNSSKALATIAQETRAGFLVESSLRCEGESMRLVSRLVEAAGQTQLWCGTFDGNRKESVLALQKGLSAALASQIHAQLSPDQPQAFAQRQPADAAAYDLYLRGRFLWHQLSGDTTKRAIGHFQRATTLDPDYALAWAGLAICFAAAPITGDASSLQVIAPARHAAAQAARSCPHLAETHTAAGFVQFWLDWNYVLAEESFRRALQLDASDVAAHRTLAIVLAYQNRAQEAEAVSQVACELDPLNAANFALASQVAYFSRDWPQAAHLARRAIAVDPGMWVGHLQLAQAQERLGDYDAALAALDQAAPLSANNSKVVALRAYIHGIAGRSEAALETLRELAALRSQRFIPPYADALIWLALGEWEQSARCLDRCIEVHDVHLSFLLVDAKWDPIRRLPWCNDFLSRCGFTLSA
jgi:TolB-like protein/Flp pilus assembly protein TadD